ncbi:MAG: DinB family protein [Bacteroidota bacterium]
MTRNEAIERNLQILDRQTQQLEQLLQTPQAQLWQKPSPKAWSAMECLEHLNLAGQYYQKEIREALATAVLHQEDQQLRSGRIGKMMAQSMRPNKAGQRRYKVKTFAATTPLKAAPERYHTILADYRTLQSEWRELLDAARTADWNQIKIRSLAGNILRLYLGDVFHFLLAHQERHLLQAEEALQAGLVEA